MGPFRSGRTAPSPPMLLVEDDESHRFRIKQTLEHSGIKNPVHMVEDGKKAVDYLSGAGEFGDRESYPLPAIVFLDLKPRLVSGFDVLAWMRQRAELTATIVVVLTASEDPQELSRAYRLGADTLLVKAPTAEQIAEQLIEMAAVFNWYWLGVESAL